MLYRGGKDYGHILKTRGTRHAGTLLARDSKEGIGQVQVSGDCWLCRHHSGEWFGDHPQGHVRQVIHEFQLGQRSF